jgi:predicted CopG family antitoxin
MESKQEITTIQVTVETWKRLAALKTLPGDTFDSVIWELLELHERQLLAGRK